MFYYKQDGIVVRESTQADVEYLKDKLRTSDVQEIWASHRHTPEMALNASLASTLCLTIDDNGVPVGMFGVTGLTVLGDEGLVWFLSSDRLKLLKIRFLRNCKKFVELMLDYYPMLYNVVDCRNTESIMWLKFIGAKFGDTMNIGEDNMPFMYFSFERK